MTNENYYLEKVTCKHCGDTKYRFDFGNNSHEKCKDCVNKRRRDFNRRLGAQDRNHCGFNNWKR